MKRNKEFLYLVLAILCVWCPLFMAAWDKDKPSSSTSLRNSNPEILANWSALETSFGAFHEYSTGGSNTGENLSIKFNTPISTPTNAANKSFLYEKDVSAVVELHWLDESGNELQMTSGGDLFSSAGLTVTSASTFNGNITLGAGSDITISGNTFTVAGTTGNTLIAGTLDVTGNIDPTTYETTNGGFLDEDDMSSDSATKVASQQSIKAFVDGITDPAYSGGESHTFEGGLIIKMGSAAVSANAAATVTFGVAFPNAVVSATVTYRRNAEEAAAGGEIWIKTKAVGSLVVYNAIDTTADFDWVVIGY